MATYASALAGWVEDWANSSNLYPYVCDDADQAAADLERWGWDWLLETDRASREDEVGE